MSSKAQLFVVAAPSGAGKTSLVHALVKDDNELVISVSHTTRAARPGEVDGVHYHFVSQPSFLAMVERGEFLEHAEVFGNFYGTHAGATRQLLAEGKDVILEIDWQGARQVRDQFPECHSLFILPPSLEALRERLSGRGQDSDEIIAGRMDKAKAEISHCDEFKHVIINDRFDEALSEMKSVIRHCRGREAYRSAEHAQLLEELLGKG